MIHLKLNFHLKKNHSFVLLPLFASNSYRENDITMKKIMLFYNSEFKYYDYLIDFIPSSSQNNKAGEEIQGDFRLFIILIIFFYLVYILQSFFPIINFKD